MMFFQRLPQLRESVTNGPNSRDKRQPAFPQDGNMITLRVAFFMATVALLAADNGYNLFQRGLAKERADADPRAAIRIYQQVLQDKSTDRKLAAQALLRMAECHQKLGDSEARKIYERLLHEYADQKDQVAVARARLAAGKAPNGVISRKLFESSTLSFPFGALSPDGRYLVYPSIHPGPRGLVLRDLTSGKDRLLTNSGTTSAFSPDSRMIAFRVANRAGVQALKVIGVDGKGERTVFERDDVEASHPSDWSPDGKYILAAISTKDRTRQIALISASDGSVRNIKSSDWRLGPPGQALYSTDGACIVYHQLQREGASNSDIFFLAVDGSRETRLVSHPADDKVVGWAPDGRLLITSNRSGTTDLYALRISAGKTEGDPELIQRGIPGDDHRVTRNGTQHYIDFHKVNGSYIVGVDVQNGRLTTPPMPVTQTTRDYNWTPAFSADGNSVALISFRGVGQISVIVKSLTSEKEREIHAQGLRVAYDLLWHPDGKSLLLRANDSSFQWGIHQLDLETRRLGAPILRVAREDSLGQFDISPDGSFLYYNFIDRTANRSMIMRRNLITGDEREIYNTRLAPGALFSFALAPKGKRLAMVTDRDWRKGDAAQWQTLDIENGTARTIPNLSQGTFAPVWTHDEKYLVFVSGKSWFRASVDDGSLIELGPTGVEGIRAYKRMHPDGTRLAFFTVKEISEFWAMENLLPSQVGHR